jgi:hypothetical protein
MLACLTVLAAAGLVSCTDAPVAPRDEVALAVAPATDSVTLTYICGNMFRVRNASFDAREVRWDIYNASLADTGSLRLRGRDVGAAFVDYYVTARTKGTMRVFVGGVLRQTKANGSKAACAAPVDTTAFAVRFFDTRSEALFTDTDSSVRSRTQLSIKFLANASGAEQRLLQRALDAQYVGGTRLFRYLRIRDVGDNADSLVALLQRVRQFSGVEGAGFVQILGPVRNDGARYPHNDTGDCRSDCANRNARMGRP